ncbi:MAG: DUF362 domain-containing protein [Bryobacterales bacterium]|nr:DUF362 domain-containing protein [Bryobacteraceae bacterium]MDW8130160.1 DUF362 domain-containing protein [Bryobacterales bacterium]
MKACTRREWLAGTATAALTGCRKVPPAEPSPVWILRAKHYSQDLYDLVRRLLAEQGLPLRGRRVVLKPNLVEFDERTTINTHPLLVHAVLEAVLALGAAEVRIAEGPGHRRNTWELAEAAGYFATVPGFERRFTDLNVDEVVSVALERPRSKLRRIYLPRTALDCDLLISLPKMKTHHWVGATLSMKNLFGLVPGAIYGWPKNILHWAGIAECIADLHRLFTRPGGRPQLFALVDGIVGMEGDGPIHGKPKPAGVLVAGSDLVAVDAACCRIMRIEPRRIPYLVLEARPGALRWEAVREMGERIRSVETPFELIPQLRSLRLS